jgi:DNA-binding winged helix-turn-helix (wHTH) protein
MGRSSGAAGHLPAEFDLGGWRVQPSLNRLTRDGATVRVEPKVMDVLVVLARGAGQVLSKSDLAGAVWPEVFVSESVITRAIAGLRRALADDAQRPRFIETIAKRGYRLLVAPLPVATGALDAEPPWRRAPSSSSEPPASVPYVVGQWVRGAGFYGREDVLAAALEGPRNGLWLLGSRAIGKTSTLKQLEHLAATGEPRRYLPLFWDLQGSDDPVRIHSDFREALADAEERLARLDLRLADVEADDFLVSLGRLRRAAESRGLALLLLIDEAEELIHLQAQSPALLRRLRRAIQSPDGVRSVLASSSRLWRLAEQDHDTSPFLHGFAPPVYLGPLDDAAARRLVRQAQAEDGRALAIPDATVEEILRRCGNHPYLLQLLGAQYWQLGDLERAASAVAADGSVRSCFAVDFGLLSAGEQAILRTLAAADAPVGVDQLGGEGPDSENAAGLLHLERLGMIRGLPGSRVELAGPLHRRWLCDHAQKL